MSIENAKELYELISEDEALQSRFEGLETDDEALNEWLDIADQQGVEVSRSDVETLLEELSEPNDSLNEEDLREVAGGNAEETSGCASRPIGIPGYSWCAGHPELAD